jgi:hypothetical protein
MHNNNFAKQSYHLGIKKIKFQNFGGLHNLLYNLQLHGIIKQK